MAKQRANTRLDPDTKQKVKEYQDQKEIGESEALRRLIRAGLAAEGHPVTAADGGTPLERIGSPRTIGIATAFMLFSGLSMLLAYWLANTGQPTLALGALILSSVTMTLAALLTTLAALAQIALARPLRDLLSRTLRSVTGGETA